MGIRLPTAGDSEGRQENWNLRRCEGQPLDLGGACLPGAFRKLPPGVSEHEARALGAEIREVHWTKDLVMFDPSDRHFRAQLDSLKRDTKEFRKELQAFVDNEELPLWVSPSHRPGSRRDHSRLSILFRPYFTSSPELPVSPKRLDTRNDESVCTLHFDAKGRFYTARVIGGFSPETRQMARALLGQHDEINASYGNWPVMARLVGTELKRAFRF
ncbi:MAG: hypothetical protein KDD70_14750 [Bdellovibrionales bacterium]|nr:hypothetical protein [Bdellovibrionales bacterium]